MLLNIHEPARYVLMQLENVTLLNIHEPAPLTDQRASVQQTLRDVPLCTVYISYLNVSTALLVTLLIPKR